MENKITDKELASFVRVGQKIADMNGYIPPEAWKGVYMPTVPTVPIEPAVCRPIHGIPHVLLEDRHDDFYNGYCFAGSYQRWPENPDDTIKRVFETQIGGLTLEQATFLRRFTLRPGDECSMKPGTTWDVPNLQVSSLYFCLAKGTPRRGKFYPMHDLPDYTLNHHRLFADHLRAYLLRREWMVLHDGIRLDGVARASQGRWFCTSDTFIPSNSWEVSTIYGETYGEEFRTLDAALEFIRKQHTHWIIFDDNGQFVTSNAD